MVFSSYRHRIIKYDFVSSPSFNSTYSHRLIAIVIVSSPSWYNIAFSAQRFIQVQSAQTNNSSIYLLNSRWQLSACPKKSLQCRAWTSVNLLPAAQVAQVVSRLLRIQRIQVSSQQSMDFVAYVVKEFMVWKVARLIMGVLQSFCMCNAVLLIVICAVLTMQQLRGRHRLYVLMQTNV